MPSKSGQSGTDHGFLAPDQETVVCPRMVLNGIEILGIANQYNQTVELDHWIRRRNRMCYWKQWRKSRTKIRNLIKLGVNTKLAISCGITSKGYWHSARTEGIQKGLTNYWLE